MSNIYEQRFFSALKDTFIGHPIKGKSGYVNLMDLKAQYFAEIEPYIKKEIDKQIEAKYREELFEKLFNFFDCYLNETGTVFFANSQIHKNLYEKVYTDRDDVALFWKTQKLYYVKSEANYDDLQTEVNGINIKFDASEIKHAKGNEKKSIQFFMVKATKDEVVFKIRYQENNKYDRLKTYLDLDKNNDIIDKCIDEYGSDLHPNIVFENTGIDQSVFNKKGDQRKCLYIENLDDALESVKVEYSINDLSLMLQYLHKNGIILYEEDLKKIFSIYKRQNEIDYFIHKDAEGFLKEQFDIYVYNWLFNDLDTDFDAATVKRIQNIKKIAHKVIEYIARFEDELKAIWEKPKFVRKCNYVLTLDRLSEHTDLIEKLIKSPGWEKQVEEWEKLSEAWIDEKTNEVLKKAFDDFIGANLNAEKRIEDNKLSSHYQFLPINTIHFEDLKFDILKSIPDLDNSIDGILIKSDNYTALNTIKVKYKNKIDFTYIDPPFNLGHNADFKYKVNYKDSTWLTLLENRITLNYDLLSDNGVFLLRNDYNGNYLTRQLLNSIFQVVNFRNELQVNRIFKNKTDNKIKSLPFSLDTVHVYAKTEAFYYKNPFVERTEERAAFWRHMNDSAGQGSAKLFFGLSLEPPIGKHWKYSQENIDNKIKNKLLKLFCKNCGYTHSEGDVYNCPECGSFDWNPKYLVKASNTKILGGDWTDIGVNSNYLELHNNWNDIPGYSNQTAFSTENSLALLERAVKICTNEGDLVLDYFLGSGSTIVAAHRLNRKWIGIEIDKQYDNVAFPRMYEILSKHGGVFKYYELEQYEEVLAKAQYQWQGKKGENQVEQYSFLQDQKLLEAIEIDYEKKNAKVVFEKLYPDVDIAETLSNLSGKHIKQLFEDKVVFEDGSEVIYDEMTFEKYPWIKPLIWWNSK